MVADPLVWHYTDGPGLLSILANQVLWATASGYLNDSGEVTLGQRLLLERFTSLVDEKDPVFTDLARRLERSGAAGQPGADWFFILSASRSPDSLAMWRTYGGRGESYAIGLDPTHDLRVLVDDVDGCAHAVVGTRPWSAVRYDPAEQDALVDAVFTEFAGELAAVLTLTETPHATTTDYLTALDRTIEAAAQALLLIKHPGFREEQETRHTTIVLGEGTREQALAPLARFRHTPYGVTPYLQLTGDSAAATGHLTTERAPLPIRAVAISPSANGAAARESVAALLASHRMPDIAIISSEIPFRG